MGVLNLPAIPSELKAITPYLQRAEEVKTQDPVISYWCAYHAAQLGIPVKVKDPNARTFLFDLLSLLERLKTEIGPNDAIDNEAVASAYVENFALRVFAIADNEDRKGNATRATAKKFLAAANFLEVLSVVSESSPSSINAPEKIRYAKWKAADIAKAFREGRKPTPGGIDEQQPESQTAEVPSIDVGEAALPSPPTGIHRSTPPPRNLSELPLQDFLGTGQPDPTSPGSWSTAATPGTPRGPDIFSAIPTGAFPPSALRKAWVNDELEGGDDGTEGETFGEYHGEGPRPFQQGTFPPSEDTSAQRVHFSSSVTGGLTPSTVEPGTELFGLPSAPPQLTSEDIASVDTSTAPVFEVDESEYVTDFVQQQPPSLSLPSLPPPPAPPVIPSPPPAFPPTPPVHSYPAHSQYVAPTPTLPLPTSAISTITHPPVELTPALISKVQKHCKFAISSLDYEDAEQAKKELRTALALLGG